MDWVLDELAHAGAEHRDPSYVGAYDRKTGFDVEAEVELLVDLGLDDETTLVDLGAGTGLLATAVAGRCRRVVAVDPSPAMIEAARARGTGFECVQAGFLTYEHDGGLPNIVYSRNALHHLPDFWKTIALERIAKLLAPGGRFVLRDIVYSCAPTEVAGVLAAWFDAAPESPADGWTRAELAAHVRTEHSTFSWLLEPMLEHSGLRIDDVWLAESRTYARYICTRP